MTRATAMRLALRAAPRRRCGRRAGAIDGGIAVIGAVVFDLDGVVFGLERA